MIRASICKVIMTLFDCNIKTQAITLLCCSKFKLTFIFAKDNTFVTTFEFYFNVLGDPIHFSYWNL